MTALDSTYTVADVATAMRCSEWMVRDLVKRGVVTPMRLGGAKTAPMRFTAADVEQLKSALRPPPHVPERRRRRHRMTP